MLTLDPDKSIEEVEAPPSIWAWPPISPANLVGLFCKARILPDLVHDVGREGTIFVGLEDHTFVGVQVGKEKNMQ